jgi:virulence factor Mce-like protein
LVIVVVAAGGGSKPYRLIMEMDNASGLASGSAVNIGGVPVGSVALALEQRAGKVLVTLNIDRRYAPVGRDVTAAIVAQNLLGQKQVEVTPGNRQDPAPSGFAIPAGHVSVTTDLDQLLQVLDPGTRARLAVLVNEAGIAFTGRQLDLSQVLAQAPDSLAQGTRLLRRLGSSNQALSDLLAAGDRYVAQATAQRAGLAHLVDRVGQTAETVATQRSALRQALAGAPSFLASARSLLADLQVTAPRLGVAARQLTLTAGPLQQALGQVGPFTRNATPALSQATRVAPDLLRLADGATPVLRRAAPTLSAMQTFTGQVLPPISGTLNGSIDNTLSVVENWARAIQFQDHLSHIFRGEASFAPDEIDSALARLTKLLGGAGHQHRGLGKVSQAAPQAPRPPAVPIARRPSTAPGPAQPSLVSSTASTLSGVVGSAVSTVTNVTAPLISAVATPPSDPNGSGDSSGAAKHLLQLLLGP